MRYNQESLLLASKQSKVDKEGKLRHKTLKENSYKDRVVRLKGNFLFFFKLDETKLRIEKEPFGWIPLEDIIIKIETYADEPFVFSLVCGNSKHYFSAPSQQTCNDWVASMQQASYTHLQSQIRSLCRMIEQRTRRDPMSDIVQRIASRNNSARPMEGRKILPASSSQPSSIQTSVLQPARKAPPPPPAATASSQQPSTWFTDLQTLQPQAFGIQHDTSNKQLLSFESEPTSRPLVLSPSNLPQGPVVKRPQVNSRPSSSLWHVPPQTSGLPGQAAPPLPPRPAAGPSARPAARPVTATGSKRGSATWFTDVQEQSPQLDPFGMDTSFHQKPQHPDRAGQRNAVYMEQSGPASQQKAKQQQPLKFNWTTFD